MTSPTRRRAALIALLSFVFGVATPRAEILKPVELRENLVAPRGAEAALVPSALPDGVLGVAAQAPFQLNAIEAAVDALPPVSGASLEAAGAAISAAQSENGQSPDFDPALGGLYDKSIVAPSAVSAGDAFQPDRGPEIVKGFIRNDEGVLIGGRNVEQFREVRRLHDKLSPHMDLSDTMNVMSDSLDEARVKLMGVEMTQKNLRLKATSIHLEQTLHWVDAVFMDETGGAVAEHTYQVYFHPAGNPDSEVAEGIRRADAYLEEVKVYFARNGNAERALTTKLRQVILTFGTRGYKQIEDHLRQKEAELRAQTGGRFSFQYITEAKMDAARTHADYDRLVMKYKDQRDGLLNIMDGVVYSRYVGLLLELKGHEYSLDRGETVLEAGRDFFQMIPQPDGTLKKRYITEFDAKVRAKDGTIILREDKSARVPLPLADAMQKKFLYKLEIYKRNRALIEKDFGAPLNVRFVVDVGGRNKKAALQGILVWSDSQQKALKEHMEQQASVLSQKYGFPISFVFINSHPGEDPMLFYKQPMSLEEWISREHQGQGSSRRDRRDRRDSHGRRDHRNRNDRRDRRDRRDRFKRHGR